MTNAQVQAFVEHQLHIVSDPHVVHSCLPSVHSLAECCFVEITRPAFRRTRIDEESAADLRQKLERTIAAGAPITFAVPFGGYKNCHAPSYPSPDWAEVFNLNYMARYLLPLTRLYSPGVVLQYTYTSGVIDVVSNMPLPASVTYMKQFRELMSVMAAQLPANLRILEVDISALYPPGELQEELRRNYDDNRIRWNEKLPEGERNKRIASAQRNMVRNGSVDLTCLGEPEWLSRCVDAAMWCEALDSLTLRRRFNKFSENIQLVFVRGPRLSVHIGSCDTSAHHFWSGCGIGEVHSGQLKQRILSGEKFAAYSEEHLVRDVPVSSPFGVVGPEFGRICILESAPS